MYLFLDTPSCHPVSLIYFSIILNWLLLFLLFSHCYARLFAAPWTAAHQISLSFTISQSLLKLMSIDEWCHPNISSSVAPFSSSPQSFPASGSFPMSQLCVRWPKYWTFSFNISPSSEYSGLISFRIDWFDLLAFQGSLKSLLQHYNSKVSILQHSTFFMVQLSHSYMTTGKTIGS